MKPLKRRFAALLLGVLSLRASPASAASLGDVLPFVAQQVPGKMLDAVPPSRSPQGPLRYQIKWLTEDGRVVWLSVDVRTGRVAG